MSDSGAAPESGAAPLLLTGNAAAVLAAADFRVHACVTSPPYYGLRSYDGDQETTWADGATCALGLEPTPEAYVEHLLEIIDVGLRRVLRSDGTLWLNLGDSYANTPVGSFNGGGFKDGSAATGGRNLSGHAKSGVLNKWKASGLKQKDLLGIPWLVAFAMRKRGWYLRAACPWIKRNCMPESVTDRPVVANEMVFLFGHPDSKGRYYYDAHGVRVEAKRGAAGSRFDQGKTKHRRVQEGPRSSDTSATRHFRTTDPFFASVEALQEGGQGLLTDPDGEPLALVVNPRPYKGAHFAVFPPALVEPMIKASTSERGCYSGCGAPWKRQTGCPCKACGAFIPAQGKACPECGHVNDWKAERGLPEEYGTTDWSTPGKGTPRKLGASGHQGAVPPQPQVEAGWAPTCDCRGDLDEPLPAMPCTVLDPFGGAGSAAVAAHSLGRRAVYIDVSEAYREQAVARLSGTPIQAPHAPQAPPTTLQAPAQPARRTALADFLASLRR